MEWQKKGFNDFSVGKLGNSGQNLYVSAKGTLQRIFQFDVNGDGYPDLLFANSHSMGERAPVYVYDNPLTDNLYRCLPSNGSFDATFCDLTGDGYDDLVLACQNNGTHTDITSFVYYGSPEGLSERYRIELPVPDARGVAAGDFNGCGKNSLAFICAQGLRIFYQDQKLGIVPYQYVDLELDCSVISSGDLDNDGYCDLYIKKTDGRTVILWGSSDGFSVERYTIVNENESDIIQGSSSTPGRRPLYRSWRPSILTIQDNKYLFHSDGRKASFYCCDRNRELSLAFSLPCSDIVAAAAGDLDGDGLEDLILLCCDSSFETKQSFVYWNENGSFQENCKTSFETVSAINAEVSDLMQDGTNQLLVCQTGTDVMRSTESLILSFDKNRTCQKTIRLESGEAMKLIAGKTSDALNKQVIAINHETGRVRGDENIYIYLGGPDGYDENRRIELPAWSAVNGLIFDYNDDGIPDVLISNCAEDAPHLDPGSYLYIQDENGFDPDRKLVIPFIRDHGAVVGDFRKSGYLDMAAGGFHNREIRIFRGGPDGYDFEHPDTLVLGPDDGTYTPPIIVDAAANQTVIKENEKSVYSQYGETRWLFTADFNGDGWLDLFVSQIVGNQCFIFWGGPEGFSSDRMQILSTSGVSCANAADLDGDGYLDLILSSHLSPWKKEEGKYETYITIYWGGPDGYQENHKQQLPTYCTNAVTIADFNGNGVLDLYASTYNSGRERDIPSYLFYGEKGGKYSLSNYQTLFNHSGSGCVSGDFNGDGYADLAIACHKTDGNHIGDSYIFWGGPNGLSEGSKTNLPTIGPHGMTTIDPGNIMDRSDNEYYYSESYKVPEGKNVKSACWDAQIPKTTWVQMQMRHANTEKELFTAKWQGLGEHGMIENGDDLLSLGFNGGYIQYKITLGAKCACGTPRIHSVTVEFA